VGIVPWWLREPQSALERGVDVATAPGAVATISTVLIVGALAALTLLAWRRRRGDVVAAEALALVLCAAVVLLTTSTPEKQVVTLGYSLRWAAPAGMWVWIALGWSGATLLPLARISRPAWRPAFGVAGVALVAVVAGVVAASGELRREPYDAMRTINDSVDDALPAGAPSRVDVATSPDGTFMALGFESGLLYAMRRDGRVVKASGLVDLLGQTYEADGSERGVRINVERRPPPEARVVARLSVPEYPDPADAFSRRTLSRRAVTVTLLPPAAP
jgi:hypothetical protein